jgi:hypothetical protein
VGSALLAGTLVISAAFHGLACLRARGAAGGKRRWAAANNLDEQIMYISSNGVASDLALEGVPPGVVKEEQGQQEEENDDDGDDDDDIADESGTTAYPRRWRRRRGLVSKAEAEATALLQMHQMGSTRV